MDELRALAYLEALGALNPLEYASADDPGGVSGGAGPEGGIPAGRARGPMAAPAAAGTAGPARRPRGPVPPGARRGGAGEIPPGFAARVNLTIPLATLLGLAERPGTLLRTGPVDPALARDLAAAAARSPRSTWCVTVTGTDHRPLAHGCGRPPPRGGAGIIAIVPPAPPATAPAPGRRLGRRNRQHRARHRRPHRDNRPRRRGGGAGVRAGEPGRAVRPQAPGRGHDPGVRLRHLTGILNACCTFPPCRRPPGPLDYEHSTPHEKGGRTCLCQAGPVCRRNHRDKQAPGWHLQHAGTRGWFRWTTPSGRSYLSHPTQYPD